MYKLLINYGNCETAYEYKTQKERQERLDNLIWVWDMEKLDEGLYRHGEEGFVKVL